MKRRRQTIAEFFRNYPFGVLLLAIFSMIVGAPLTAEAAHHLEGIQGPSGLAPLTILLTVSSAYAVWNLAHHRAVVICAAGVILALLGLSSIELSRLGLDRVLSRKTVDLVHVVAQTLFLLYVTATILRMVFRARIVDGNILCGAACVYLLAGIVWGYGYTMLEIADRGSFSVVAPNMEKVDLYDEPGWLVYFSFTTLTTVGFGDVLPAKAFARSLAVFEAVVGQIMLVVMMARLVGLHVAHSTSAKPHSVEFSTDEN
ncbi:MAG: potassium channel family protein [Terrimicrobiaceae bacterium]|nr:potassium channel family protein [Terrimicrobiaceae bacterium]